MEEERLNTMGITEIIKRTFLEGYATGDIRLGTILFCTFCTAAIAAYIFLLYKNINKTYAVRKIEKRLKKLQRQVSRKYEQNKKGKEYVKTKNIIKLEKQIQQVDRRLANIRNNYLHRTTTSIVKTKPYRVVIEDLNVKGMMKNKHLSDAIRKQGFYEFRRQLGYKCKFRGIELVVADRFYPSSKTCSQCGKINKDLKLKDRVYSCSCGLSIDRDLNACINLSRYKLA